jgi:hypothetical protein
MCVCNTDFGLLNRFNLEAFLFRPIINKLKEVTDVLSRRNLLIGEVRNTEKNIVKKR